MDRVELQDVELFVFTDNLLFKSIYYKGTSNIPLLLEIVLLLHKIYMKGDLILHVVHISGTRIIEAGIDGLSIWNNLGGMVIVFNPLKFVPVDVWAVERSPGLEAWLRSWWGGYLNKFSLVICLRYKEIICYGHQRHPRQKQL